MIKFDNETFTVEMQGANEQILSDLSFVINVLAEKMSESTDFILSTLKKGFDVIEIMELLSGKKSGRGTKNNNNRMR